MTGVAWRAAKGIHRLAKTPPEKRKYLRKSQMWSQDFTAKLFCKVEFWLERLPVLIEAQPKYAVPKMHDYDCCHIWHTVLDFIMKAAQSAGLDYLTKSILKGDLCQNLALPSGLLLLSFVPDAAASGAALSSHWPCWSLWTGQCVRNSFTRLTAARSH
jgi:hypothetical protein